jgi:hypothetical protein
VFAIDEILELIRLSNLFALEDFFSVLDSPDPAVSRLLFDMLRGKRPGGGDFASDFPRARKDRQPLSMDRRERPRKSRCSILGEVGVLRKDETEDERAEG